MAFPLVSIPFLFITHLCSFYVCTIERKHTLLVFYSCHVSSQKELSVSLANLYCLFTDNLPPCDLNLWSDSKEPVL